VAKLVIYEEVEGEETIFEDFELFTNRILIGSGSDNHLVLEAPDIDPAHASLELRNDNWILQDLGGPGGTLVNDQSVDGPYRLQNNDFIELGSIKMRYQADQFEVEEEVTEEEAAPEEEEEHISGRVWFATVAGGTLAAIFIILLLLIIADFLGVLKISDLLPWLGQFY
jgi:predicted component of type VI protein secretion system